MWFFADKMCGDGGKRGWLEFAGVENDGLEIDGVEQEQTYIGLLHPMKNFSVYDM